mmetsp:Transcript_100456/g.292801  ORF Transcript_100456/g.292801 Transcript_100456/m.292801 type:complete len:223 (-) Transcript_100456:1686-2354(-)
MSSKRPSSGAKRSSRVAWRSLARSPAASVTLRPRPSRRLSSVVTRTFSVASSSLARSPHASPSLRPRPSTRPSSAASRASLAALSSARSMWRFSTAWRWPSMLSRRPRSFSIPAWAVSNALALVSAAWLTNRCTASRRCAECSSSVSRVAKAPARPSCATSSSRSAAPSRSHASTRPCRRSKPAWLRASSSDCRAWLLLTDCSSPAWRPACVSKDASSSSSR